MIQAKQESAHLCSSSKQASLQKKRRKVSFKRKKKEKLQEGTKSIDVNEQ